MKTILVVDDEKKIREVITSYLHNEGYVILEAATGKEALAMFKQHSIDFVILDLMLPDFTGEKVCQKIREQSPVPILMLTAKVTEEDRIRGLSIGADDYVTKPFSPREIVARVKAILRRSGQELLASQITYNNGDLVIDTVKQSVFKNGVNVHLTLVEYKLLLVLARHPERPFSREELIEKIFGFDYEGEDRTIDQHIKNLRHKIETNPKKPVYILTVYGYGYRFVGRKL